jgi:release factor glutamine methyltransferase
MDREEAWLLEFAKKNGLDVEPLLKKRNEGVPLAYLMGTQPFHEIVLKVDERVLVPRPETEELVEHLLAALPPKGVGLDLGCGSGAIALALSKALPEWRFTATDVSGEALSLARENAALLGLSLRVDFQLGSWWDAVPNDAVFDLIVTNPPYVGTGEEIDLGASFEPRLALFAGLDGLDAYREILPNVKAHLKPGALFAGECGPFHGKALLELAKEFGLSDACILKDRAGRERFLFARKD